MPGRRVTRSWKKHSGGQIEITTGDSCAYEFAVGREDLLFLKTASSGWATDSLPRQEPVSNAGKMLDWLRHRE